MDSTPLFALTSLRVFENSACIVQSIRDFGNTGRSNWSSNQKSIVDSHSTFPLSFSFLSLSKSCFLLPLFFFWSLPFAFSSTPHLNRACMHIACFHSCVACLISLLALPLSFILFASFFSSFSLSLSGIPHPLGQVSPWSQPRRRFRCSALHAHLQGKSLSFTLCCISFRATLAHLSWSLFVLVFTFLSSLLSPDPPLSAPSFSPCFYHAHRWEQLGARIRFLHRLFLFLFRCLSPVSVLLPSFSDFTSSLFLSGPLTLSRHALLDEQTKV